MLTYMTRFLKVGEDSHMLDEATIQAAAVTKPSQPCIIVSLVFQIDSSVSVYV